jgi:hypothetical protein
LSESGSKEHGIDRYRDTLARLHASEWLLLGLQGEVADTPARYRDRAGHSRGNAAREEHVEALCAKRGFALRVIPSLDERDATETRPATPIARPGIEDDAARSNFRNAEGPCALPSIAAPSRREHDGEHRMREKGEKWRIGLRQDHVHGARVLGADLADDSRLPSQEPGDDSLSTGRLRMAGEDLPLETVDDMLG